MCNMLLKVRNFIVRNFVLSARWIYGKNKRKTHMDITSESNRIPTISKATVINIYQLSPTVKGFTLKIHEPAFTFMAGQWVDTFIPDVTEVGGFSICSSPSQLKYLQTVDLGIKWTIWPPGRWFHEKCTVGAELSVRVGGDFYFAPLERNLRKNILLIAGGVGINPLFSVYSQLVEHKKLCSCNPGSSEYFCGKITLLYSAKSEEELIYKSSIDDQAAQFPDIRIHYFVTQNSSNKDIKTQRIDYEVVSAVVEELGDKRNTIAYICGPLTMITAAEEYLRMCEISQSNIFSEKWW